jgi:xanthine dehydrogenase YagS FAD-binding subunit
VRPASVDRSKLELLRPDSVEAAAAAVGNGAVALAGGTELVPLLREGIVEATTLVQIGDVVPKGIREGWIGAGTTLGELEADPQIPAVLQQACALASSPQLRAMGTVAGNLLQATRCWYWRLQFPCRLHGGDRCFAREGLHREHAIVGNDYCASAHPSDVAAALLSLGTTLRTSQGELPLAELYRLPTESNRATTTLGDAELILELEYEQALASTYLKAMDRKRFAFAIVGVAAARYESGTRLVLSGIAPIPWAIESEAELEQATPLPGTAYKVEIARALVRRALEAIS